MHWWTKSSRWAETQTDTPPTLMTQMIGLSSSTEIQMASWWNRRKLSDIYVRLSMGRVLGRIRLRRERKSSCWNFRWKRDKIRMDSCWTCWVNINESLTKLIWWLISARRQQRRIHEHETSLFYINFTLW